MNIIINTEPFPLAIIENLYTKEEHDIMFKEMLFLNNNSNKFQEGKETVAAKDDKDKILNNTKGAFIDEIYAKREFSDILTINRKTFKEGIPLVQKHSDYWYFKNMTTTKDHTLVSHYKGSGEFYRAHFDYTYVTAVSWFFKEPKNFTGGNIRFTDYNIEIPVSNTITVMFPGVVKHEVTETKVIKGVSPGPTTGRYVMAQLCTIGG